MKKKEKMIVLKEEEIIITNRLNGLAMNLTMKITAKIFSDS
jgi:hypothetical protein